MKFDTPATSNPLDQIKVIGKPVDRIDGPLKTTGAAPYAYERHDVARNQAYGYVLGAAIAKGPGGDYRNPLRGVSGLVPQRIDDGVDFAGLGPVYALGDAVVTGATLEDAIEKTLLLEWACDIFLRTLNAPNRAVLDRGQQQSVIDAVTRTGYGS